MARLISRRFMRDLSSLSRIRCGDVSRFMELDMELDIENYVSYESGVGYNFDNYELPPKY
jgi:hypothetical protein